MKQPFVVLGYGIPKDILKDENYRSYLGFVFNAIFDWCTVRDQWDPVIIFSGGKTDMWKPYRRTEASEMIRAFRALMKRPAVKKRVRGWTLVPESRALSTLENLINVKDICRTRSLDDTRAVVFGEQTRSKRLATLTKKILPSAKVVAVDFDQTANRYRDPAFLKQKESETLRLDRWALQDPKNLKQHHKLYQQKITYLRNAGPTKHVDAINRWWEEKLREMKEKPSQGQ